MRKFLLAALAALTLAGCQKNVSEPVKALIFTSEEPSTRTGWNGETIEWTAGDAISMAYSVNSSWVGPNLYPSDALRENSLTAAFRVPGNFPTDLVGAHHFYAVYPAVAGTDFSGAPDVFTAVPEVQTPTATSFDPAADLMAATSTGDWRSLPASPIPMIWTRLTAHGDITLKNLPLAPGENVRDIILLAQNGAHLTGDVAIDLGNPTEFETAGVPRVTVLADNLSVDASGNLRFWVSIFPVTLTGLTVIVETDQATYFKAYDELTTTFKQNARNKLGINMADAVKTTAESGESAYKLLASAPDNWGGEYLIVYKAGSLALNGALTTLDQASNTISVSIENGVIASTDATDAARFTISPSGNGYAIRAASGKYIGQGSNSNGLASSDTPLVNTLSFNASDQSVTIVGSGNAHLRYNKQNGQERFRYFKSSTYSAQEPVHLYKLSGSTGPAPATPTVKTGTASSITKTEAILSATYTGMPTYGGFEWGLSADDLSENWQAAYVNNGAFEVKLDNLGDGVTYYYRAYVGVLENGRYAFYYGDVRSFTTKQDGIVIGDSQPGWFEVPLMDIEKSGNYLVNASDPSLYYAWHICAGGEMAAGGKPARNFTVCFSEEHHVPMWVAAPLHSMFKGSGRHEAWGADPKIPKSIQYSSSSTGSGCNKGHMLGSADRNHSVATNQQVFVYSNIAPQLGAGFNTGGGGWNIVEDFVDKQYCADTLYAVIGCYFDRFTDGYGMTATPKTISFGGRNDVSMPTMFYYALIRTKRGNSGKSLKNCTSDEIKCAAFVRTHTNDLKGQAVTSREMMSISDLERITGVTYFPNVPNAPKNTFKASDWGL